MHQTQYPKTPHLATNDARALAFEQAVIQYDTLMIRYFNTMTRDQHLAEDLAQDLWVAVHRTFETHQFFEYGLLRRKAYQVFIDNARKRNVRSFVTTTDELPEVASPAIFAEPNSDEAEAALREHFWAQFHGIELTETQKTVFWLKERYGYTMQEIADKLGLPISTLHDWIGKVKRLCLAHLNKDES